MDSRKTGGEKLALSRSARPERAFLCLSVPALYSELARYNVWTLFRSFAEGNAPGTNPIIPSANAQRMAALEVEVLQRWSLAVRNSLKDAEKLSEPLLINTFPVLYQNLVQAITPEHPRTTAGEGNTVASEHGGERARLTDYRPEAIILEYQLLRQTIFNVLTAHGIQLNHAESSIVHESIDNAIYESVGAFSLAQAALRERFIASLTHDLRTPLFTARASAELIQGTSDVAKIERYADFIVKSLRRVDSMIQKMLDASTLHSGERVHLHFRNFDMFSLVSELCDDLATVHGSRFVCRGAESAVWWDRDAVTRAIENLAGNAIKYGANAAPVTITVRSSHGRTVVDVHNEGEPIPEDQHETVFRAFQRAAAGKAHTRDGWGIGLAYVRAVAESHGGSIGLDSEAGRGTTFTLDMPTDARPYESAPTLHVPPSADASPLSRRSTS